MLHSYEFRDGDRPNQLYAYVMEMENFPNLLQFWMAHVARDLLRLGVYFRAAILLHELPGGARYRPLIYDSVDPLGVDDNDNPCYWLQRIDHEGILNVLAECFRRLGSSGYLKRVPGGADHEPEELTEEWTAYLDRHAKIKHGLLSVVAVCLDELIVKPGLEEIDAGAQGTWWQQWWSRMEE